MNIIELILDEDEELSGIEAISVVEAPAIELDFLALKSQKEYKLTQVDDEKHILMGPALVPEKPIYRNNGEDEFYIYFSKDTVRKASQLFLKKGNQGKSTLEHAESLAGMTVVESWLVEDKVHDKSRKYGLDVPVGTWMISMKVDNDEIWNDFVKTGRVKGFSIEGYFADKLNRPNDKQKDQLESEDDKLIKQIIDALEQ
ncbi:MAG: putative peptidase [Prokaryotic dsDNA virus sp.]|nr:MAG: putative peptidase [Prokaryotic dsDNA virus sp.]|tara:strand:+ start:10288 stop:10887 length:600 start_codon:yes stop_codon:yes gene_type:complete